MDNWIDELGVESQRYICDFESFEVTEEDEREISFLVEFFKVTKPIPFTQSSR